MKEILDKIKERLPDVDAPQGVSLKEMQVKWFNESEGDLHKYDGYDCKLCRNKGFISKLEGDSDVLYHCRCQKIRATLYRAKRSGLGDVLRDFTFGKYQATDTWQKEIKEKALQFCEDDAAKWFFIGGQVGCGKTHICTAIASHYINAGKELRYMVWADDCKFLKRNVNEPAYQEKMEDYKNVDVLYIDDFLKVKQGEEPTTADINIAFEIINHRLLSKDKTTIISSEKLLSEIIDYDEATMSRIFQMAGAYKFSIAKDRAKNYRLRF